MAQIMEPIMFDPVLFTDAGKALAHGLPGHLDDVVVDPGRGFNEFLYTGGHVQPSVAGSGFWLGKEAFRIWFLI